LKFIATCNPYRTKHKIKSVEGLIKKNEESHKSQKLAYTVNPLPHAIMNFILNFGELSEEDERQYITKMLAKVEGLE